VGLAEARNPRPVDVRGDRQHGAEGVGEPAQLYGRPQIPAVV
jgi:hypothetical protein